MQAIQREYFAEWAKGEVEHALRRHSAVDEVCVILHTGSDGEKQLVAFVIPRPDCARPSAAQLKRHVAGLLPVYMVPAAVLLVDSFPLTTATKVDRKALSRTFEEKRQQVEENSTDDEAFEQPQGWIEETIAQIFGDTLQIGTVGAVDE